MVGCGLICVIGRCIMILGIGVILSFLLWVSRVVLFGSCLELILLLVI